MTIPRCRIKQTDTGLFDRVLDCRDPTSHGGIVRVQLEVVVVKEGREGRASEAKNGDGPASEGPLGDHGGDCECKSLLECPWSSDPAR